MKFGLLAIIIAAVGVQAQETITSIGQIEEITRSTQEQFWRLVPPADGDTLFIQPGSKVYPVDWKAFKNKTLTSQMTAEMQAVNSSMYPIYRITVVEARTGELLWYNSLDQLVWQTPAPVDYNPYLFAFLHFDVDSAEALSTENLLWGRSSNVGTEILLLPESFMESYEEDVAMEAGQEELLLAQSEPMAMMSMGAGVDLLMGIVRSNATVEVLVEWLATLDSDTLDLFRATDLAAADWQLATNFPTASSTNFWWSEQESQAARFYVAGTDYDEDLDGLTSARERYLYKTREDLEDTDDDGLSDFFEIQNGYDPLYGDSNTNGIGDLAEANLADSVATNGSGGVLVVVPETGWYHAIAPNLNLVYLGE